MDLKQLVYNHISKIEMLGSVENLYNLLTFTADSKNGDITLPCFSLSKIMHKSPIEIGDNIVAEISDELFDKVENVKGYVNFFLNKKKIFEEITKDTNLLVCEKVGTGKTVFVDFSSLNLAKYMHIGHLSTTIIGSVISNILEYVGYNVVRLNYVGDYGTPFGKMITAIKRWGNVDDIEKLGVDYIQGLYVRFNQEADSDESLMEEARDWFIRIENKDPEAIEINDRIIRVSMKEAKRLCDILDIKFDSWTGEAYYNDKMQPIIDELENKQMLTTSEGAKVVDLSQYDLGVCMIQKSDGGSLYATRDITAAIDRYNKYNFDMGIYVTSVQQSLHFARFFKVLELMGRDYATNLKHIYYGTYSLPTGKIGSRFGKQALVKDMLEQSIAKAKEIIEARGSKGENLDKLSESIGIGAIKFGVLKTERLRDCVFDLESSLNFDGETSPYIQYTFARCNSIIGKTEGLEVEYNLDDIDNTESFEILKHINNFVKMINEAYTDFEPCYISRFMLNLCSLFNRFYNNYRIIDEGKVSQCRLKLVELTRECLDTGLMLLGIDRPQSM